MPLEPNNMTMHIVDPIDPVALWPLEEPLAAVFVAGRTLRECQEELAPAGEVVLVGNAWVTSGDWELLLGTDGPAVLETHDGETLAWTGEGARPEDGVVAMASGSSFLVKGCWDLLRVNEEVLGTVRGNAGNAGGAQVDGLLVVGKGTKVLPGVYVEGCVVIGADCKIGPNCYLRGSTTIGDGCHIGQAVEVKNSIIGPGSSVGHISYVGDSILGEKVNFGAGTMTSNLRHDGKCHRTMVAGELVDTGRRKFGTMVGNFVHTGIHTAIYPGRKLGPGTSTLPSETIDRDKV